MLAIGSVGSLSEELPVGSLVCPDDFIALHLGLSIFADERAHSTPGFDPTWRAEVLAAWRPGRAGCVTAASTGRRSGRASRRQQRSA